MGSCVTDPELSFPTDNGRYYKHPTKPASVPSVTNILRQKNKPAIAGSQIRKAAEYATDNREKLAALTRDEAVRLIKGTQYQASPEARIGDIVHAWVDHFIKTGEHPKDAPPIELKHGEQVAFTTAPLTARRMWLSFVKFCEVRKPTFTAAEFTVWSYTHGYAGTADWSAVISDMLVLADTKTGKGVYGEAALQLAALSKADVMLTTQGIETELPKYDRVAVLHLRPTFHTLVPIDKLDSCLKAFLGLKAMFDHEVENGDKVLMYSPKIETDYRGA
jgi:hypothetical protein